jgi:hypothetical protein
MIYCANFESFLFSSEFIFWGSSGGVLILWIKYSVFFNVRKIRHQKIVFLKQFVMVLHGIAVLVLRTHSNSVSLHYFGIVFLLLLIVSRVSINYGFLNVQAVLFNAELFVLDLWAVLTSTNHIMFSI